MRMEKIYDEQVRSSPTYRRAWILQERLLSPRSVYFGTDQVFWACGNFEVAKRFPVAQTMSQPDHIMRVPLTRKV